MAMIEDGKGTGLRAEVNSKNRIVTETVVFDREDDSISDGLGYQIAARVVYTAASAGVPVGVMYFKNTEDVDVVLDRVVLMIGSVTGSTTDWTHRILRNPTGGSVISNAIPAGISNSNHGSANILNGGTDIFQGIETDTISGGTGAPLPIQQQSNRILFPIGRRIPKNSSFGIEITPPVGTTAAISVTVCHVFLDTNQL
jgi:hypothetical protein